jgi:23S rRNA (uracil-5-)-methyltransferase RumA
MSHRKKMPVDPVTVQIDSLSHDGRGIAHIHGKTVFVEQGLPGEEARIEIRRSHSRYAEARITELIRSSPDRIGAKCRHYSVCGGCSFQHVSRDYQISHKQRILLEQLQHIGGVKPEHILPPLIAAEWGYRRKARLSVKFVEKKHKVLVGFREKSSSFIAELSCCEVLHPAVGLILADLQQLIGRLSIHRHIPQIEVAVADNATALVIRHLAELTHPDRELLRGFEQWKKVLFYLQPGGVETIQPLSPDRSVELVYTAPEFNIEFAFLPADFVQVNGEMNNLIIRRALELLELRAEDTVLDLFCGLGNFSLPMARYCRSITGVEGEQGLIERARQNAERNKIMNVEFHHADLVSNSLQGRFPRGVYTRVLLDPPRTGAGEILGGMSFSDTERIVYISCNPATLARDAGILTQDKGFQLRQAGIADMFPHTSHIESVALFTR